MNDIKAVFDELDMHQLSIFARMSPGRRLAIAFDLCEFAQRMVVSSIRREYPGISDQELRQRLRSRVEMAYGA